VAATTKSTLATNTAPFGQRAGDVEVHAESGCVLRHLDFGTIRADEEVVEAMVLVDFGTIPEVEDHEFVHAPTELDVRGTDARLLETHPRVRPHALGLGADDRALHPTDLEKLQHRLEESEGHGGHEHLSRTMVR
jgi:hypothetical protein